MSSVIRARAGRAVRRVKRLARTTVATARRTGRPSLPGPPGTAPAGACMICHAPGVRSKEVALRNKPKRRKTVHVCNRCGFIAMDGKSPDRYRGKQTLDEMPQGGSRIGSAGRPGREFQMAKMALDMLGRRNVDVLVYGAGRSLDNQHIQRLKRVRQVSIGDIMRVRDDAPFVDLNEDATRRFDVVVASEVVEHFRDPPADFARLFSFVADDGLIVCGTSINNGRRALKRHRYIFYPDHTSFYTPASLRMIARWHGMFLDFRYPRGLKASKRYVMFTRSPDVLAQVTSYFGSHRYAPSEADLDDTPEAPGQLTSTTSAPPGQRRRKERRTGR